ncbi:MAG: RluA family pseudouridine synthase [Planctomycetota bacterium]|jgi:RluA family pseudouridine synthase
MDYEAFDSADYHVVPVDHHGLELDEYLCLLFPGVTKGALRRMIRGGRILVDGEAVNPSHRVRAEQVLVIDLDAALEVEGPAAPAAPLGVLHEDESVLIVDKPPGVAVEPERWDRGAPTMAGALLARARADAEAGRTEWRPRLCHRLDKDTTGCLAVARDLETERRLRQAFEEGRIEKRYLALVEGEFDGGAEEWTTIDRAIAKSDRRAGQMRVSHAGKPSITDVRVAERYRGYTLVECRPRTGRTHQIRVHLADAGHPLAVDPLYGRRDALLLSEIKRGYKPKRGQKERPLMDRLTLHAASLVLPTPEAGESSAPDPAELDFTGTGGASSDGRWIAARSPLPADLERITKQLRKVRAYRT